MKAGFRSTVAKLVAELDGPETESAFCALRDLPEALPLVAEAYEHATDSDVSL